MSNATKERNNDKGTDGTIDQVVPGTTEDTAVVLSNLGTPDGLESTKNSIKFNVSDNGNTTGTMVLDIGGKTIAFPVVLDVLVHPDTMQGYYSISASNGFLSTDGTIDAVVLRDYIRENYPSTRGSTKFDPLAVTGGTSTEKKPKVKGRPDFSPTVLKPESKAFFEVLFGKLQKSGGTYPVGKGIQISSMAELEAVLAVGTVKMEITTKYDESTSIWADTELKFWNVYGLVATRERKGK